MRTVDEIGRFVHPYPGPYPVPGPTQIVYVPVPGPERIVYVQGPVVHIRGPEQTVHVPIAVPVEVPQKGVFPPDIASVRFGEVMAEINKCPSAALSKEQTDNLSKEQIGALVGYQERILKEQRDRLQAEGSSAPEATEPK